MIDLYYLLKGKQSDSKQYKIEYYYRDGKKSLLCLIRKKLVPATPEEIVRQKFIIKLLTKYEVPKEMIDVEEHLSHFVKGVKGRADIIVYKPKKAIIDGQLKTLPIPYIIVECKAPNVEIASAIDQILRYFSVLGSKYLVITNGNETLTFKFFEETENFELIKDLPKYEDLDDENAIELEETEELEFKPFKISASKSVKKELLDYGYIGEDTDLWLVPLVANLSNFIYNEKNLIPRFNFKNYVVIDKGLKFMSNGNAAGGNWEGDYRYFILKDKNQDTDFTISFSLMGKSKDWGRGNTTLIVAIEYLGKSHNSLQYALDRYIVEKDGKYHFWHNGTLTVGKKGRAKNKEVVEFIRRRSPKLIRNGQIYLGYVYKDKQMTWQQPNVRELITNLMEYALMRDEFRKLKA